MPDVSDTKSKQDFDDLQNEIAGRSTGRMTRFLTGEDRNDPTGEKKRAADRMVRDLLDVYLRDPEYRALYEDLGTKLRGAETEAEQIIAALEAQIAAMDETIRDMEDRAARGPDGQPVFRTADGRVVSADGEELPPEIAAGIIWPDNAPSAEAYFDAKAKRDALQDDLRNWHDYRNDTLGGIRDRYEDRENPMKKNELEGALEDIERMRPVAHGANVSHAEAESTPSEIPVAFPQVPFSSQ